MFKHVLMVALVGLISACDSGEPAGGRGPFDPPPPVKINAPLFASPPRDGSFSASPLPQPTDNSSAALAQDVTTALQTTPSTTPLRPQPVNTQPVNVAGGGIGIDPNDQVLNLSLSTQEEQKRQRDIAEQRRAANRQQLVVVQPEPVPDTNTNANAIAFARSTTHPVGTKVYNRPTFRSRTQSASVCRRFATTDEAQRQFLGNGGPTTDRFNLDPDGDGFACGFDPETYRKLKF